MDKSVSILIPVYGDFDRKRTAITVKSMSLQTEVDLEVILVEQSDNPSFSSQDFDRNVKYFHTPIGNLTDNQFFTPAITRNLAAGYATKKFIYSSDGDIIFQNKHFLKEILELFEQLNIPLYRPPMRRLPLEHFEDFLFLCDKFDINKALEQLNKNEDYIANIKFKKPVKMKSFEKIESGRKKIFLYTEKEHEEYKQSDVGNEPKFSTLHLHAGGTFMLRYQFYEVAGFSPEYSGWGCQDADLQWKLKEKIAISQIPNEPRFEVLHLDHKKNYFSKERWNKNKVIQLRRKKEGIEQCINLDRRLNERINL